LEEGDFERADRHLAEAERIQITTATLPALERQSKLRFARGQAALLNGEIRSAAEHWEAASSYFTFIDRTTEANKRYDYSEYLREYAYRYKSVEALHQAAHALERNLLIWTRDEYLELWCKATIALGDVCWRRSQFDGDENFSLNIANAKRLYDSVRDECTQVILPFFRAISERRIANILSERANASSDKEYLSNLECSLKLQISAISFLSKEGYPEEWGISQHNLGLSYIYFFKARGHDIDSQSIIDRAVHHLDLSLEVRDAHEALQYWVASRRSMGEALIERSKGL
jgi:hypothetical protein